MSQSIQLHEPEDSMRSPFVHLVALLLLLTTCLHSAAEEPPATPQAPATSAQLEFFEKEVRPLLAQHCYSCHSVKAKKLQAGLLMDSRAAILTGGDSGAAMVPGDVDGSLLIEAVRYESYEMPPKGKLPDSDIAILERWVKMGAPWPDEAAPMSEVAGSEFDLHQRKSDHWVWQPIQSPAVPNVVDNAWPRDDLDRFVLASLENAGLKPAGDADRSAVMRRLYFDLIGLPPSPQQSAEFLNDTSPTATERLVDQLLESPHFGERWGRHWLDLVRYAESRGHEFDNDSPNAFQYRDYIIRALNADVPYDQLVREHIAGDILDQPRLNAEAGYNESVLGTGFWFLGEWVHSPVDIRKDEADRFDNMIDVMSKTFLGVTVSCARCHDHKFDAISTADYYSLSGFLQGSDFRQVRFESLEHNRKIADSLSKLDASYRNRIRKKLSAAGVTLPSAPPLPDAVADCIVVDYATLPSNEYLQDGYIFGNQPRHTGDAYLTTTKKVPTLSFANRTAASSDSFWNGLESTSEKGVQDRSKLAKLPRSGRTLRTPTFTVTSGNVACRVKGTGHIVACVDSHRLIAGPLHQQTIVAIKPNSEWVQLRLDRYIGHRLHLEFTPAKDTQLEVSFVVQGASQETRDHLTSRAQFTAKNAVAFAQEANKALGKTARKTAQAWANDRAKLHSQVMRRSKLAIAMLDGTGEDDHILIRGNSSKPGNVEPRHFLTAVTGDSPMKIQTGSGRLELAAQINAADNPLASRVIVNRIWHHLMGRGIVPTTDDFGVLGQRPTHPELLDHLAVQFMNDGRSMKQMIRRIVLSRSYQMSSKPDPNAVQTDPKNLLWHHRPPKRLQGEVIRDSLLSLSGQLDLTQFGEPIPIHLTSFMDGRGRPGKSGPLDGDRRRSIYIAVRRNFLSPFMLTFDSPTPFSTMGRRNASNVPAQSLILLNDPFVVAQTNKWAARTIEAGGTVDVRIENMYQAAFARQPTPQEKAVAMAFVKTQAAERKVKPDDTSLWSDLAHAFINTKEFIFLR